MKRIDFNCYCGNWPFFRVRYNTLQKLAQLHSRCGIEGGFVSSCEAIFYQDPYEAEILLANELKGTPYLQAMVLNPTLPGWKDDLMRAIETLNIKAVRLTPGFHGYTLIDPVLDQVSEILRQYSLPLLLTLRIRDERSAWMIQPRKIPVEEIAAYLDKNRDIVTLISCARLSEIIKLTEQFAGRENLFADVSGLKDGNFIVEKACEAVGSEHIVYGSSAPLLDPRSTTMLVDRAALPEETRCDIFNGGNLIKLL